MGFPCQYLTGGRLTTDQEVGGSNPLGYAIFLFVYVVIRDCSDLVLP